MLICILTSVAIISRIKFNGLVLNFDYGIYQPDGSHYAYRTLTFLGVDSHVAAERVVNWYQIHGVRNNQFSPSLLFPENTETWGLVAPRIIYPLLSVPFVYLLGLSGMMVIPILTFVLLVFSIFRLSELHNKQIIGISLILIISTSPTVLRWMIANITDGVLAGLFGIVVLIISSKLTMHYWNLYMIPLVIITSMTRFCFPIWIAITTVYWIKKMRAKSIIILVCSTIAFIPTYLFMPANAVLPANQEVHGWSKILLLGESFIKVGFIEVAELAALDRILLVTLILAFAISIKFPKQISSMFFLSVLLSVWIIGAINGTLGVNFRYQLPLLGFACWVITINLGQFANWISGRRINIVSKETEN